MPYIHFTEDQKLRANSVDLVEFLRRQGEKLISSGQDKRLTSDHSITVHGKCVVRSCCRGVAMQSPLSKISTA